MLGTYGSFDDAFWMVRCPWGPPFHLSIRMLPEGPMRGAPNPNFPTGFTVGWMTIPSGCGLLCRSLKPGGEIRFPDGWYGPRAVGGRGGKRGGPWGMWVHSVMQWMPDLAWTGLHL